MRRKRGDIQRIISVVLSLLLSSALILSAAALAFALAASNDREPRIGTSEQLWLYATIGIIAACVYVMILFFEVFGMTEDEKNDIVARIVRWAKEGGRIRKMLAAAGVSMVRAYYCSVESRQRRNGKKPVNSKRKLRLIKAFLLSVLIVCLGSFVHSNYVFQQHDQEMETLKEKMLTARTDTVEKEVVESDVYRPDKSQSQALQPDMSDGDIAEPYTMMSGAEQAGEIKADDSPIMLKRFEALYEENNDLAGWISISGTGIDYPVVQSDDEEYYLHHDFYGEEDRHGCLFVKAIADVNTPGTNFVIYGHNMKDGAMFGNLDLYRKESFYREHPVIFFDTLYEDRTYEVMAVFNSQVYGSEDDVFKYYQFYQADTQEEFDYFYDNIKKLSLYDTGVTAEFGDTFLTLSTCAYHVDDGRLAVVAKRKE